MYKSHEGSKGRVTNLLVSGHGFSVHFNCTSSVSH